MKAMLTLEELKQELEKLNQQESDLKWGFDRFWKNEFKLEAEPWEVQMKDLEDFINSEKEKKEEVFNSWEKDW